MDSNNTWPKDILMLVLGHLNGDGKSMLNIMLSCTIYYKWMHKNKQIDPLWKKSVADLRRRMNRNFIDFDNSEASLPASGSWQSELYELNDIKRNWRTGVCRSRAVDMHNYGSIKFCKYDNKHIFVCGGDGRLSLMKLSEHEPSNNTSGDGGSESASDGNVPASPSSVADREKSSRVSLRKKKRSNLWELKTVRSMKTNTDAVSYCIPFENSPRFITGGWDCKVKIWDFNKLKATRIAPDFGSVEAMELYEDRLLFIGTSAEHPVYTFDLETLTIVNRPSILDGPAVWTIEQNKKNKLLAFGNAAGLVTFHDVRTHDQPYELDYYNTAIRSLRWQPNSEYNFFTSTAGSVFHMWDLRKLGEPLRKMEIPTARSDGIFIRIQANDHIIAGAGDNGMLYVYDAKTFALLYMIPVSQHSANGLVLDEFTAYMAFTGGAVRILDFDILPEHANVNPKTKVTPKSMHKLIGLHGYDYKGHVY